MIIVLKYIGKWNVCLYPRILGNLGNFRLGCCPWDAEARVLYHKNIKIDYANHTLLCKWLRYGNRKRTLHRSYSCLCRISTHTDAVRWSVLHSRIYCTNVTLFANVQRSLFNPILHSLVPWLCRRAMSNEWQSVAELYCLFHVYKSVDLIYFLETLLLNLRLNEIGEYRID